MADTPLQTDPVLRHRSLADDGPGIWSNRRMPDVIEVERTIAAAPQHLYELVSDLTRMGEWSPENRGGRWVGGATGPVVGARFRGRNRIRWRRWSTTCTVTEATPGEAFAFRVKAGPLDVAEWSFRLRPADESGSTHRRDADLSGPAGHGHDDDRQARHQRQGPSHAQPCGDDADPGRSRRHCRTWLTDRARSPTSPLSTPGRSSACSPTPTAVECSRPSSSERARSPMSSRRPASPTSASPRRWASSSTPAS